PSPTPSPYTTLFRPPGRDRAEAAAARARVAEQHHGGGSLAPALADVGTARLLADRVQVELPERVLEPGVALTAGRADLQPRRLRDRKSTRLNSSHVA